MKWAVAPDDQRILATRNTEGRCPACSSPVFAKCGDQVDWHWAHAVGEGADCELGEGLDADEYTGWHVALQTHAVGLGATIEATHPTKKRRADILTRWGHVIELQHSRIDRDVVLGREADWTPIHPMFWLWDAAQWKTQPTRRPSIFLLPKSLIPGNTPIFLDVGTGGEDLGPGVHKIEWLRPARKGSGWAAELRPTGLDVFSFLAEADAEPKTLEEQWLGLHTWEERGATPAKPTTLHTTSAPEARYVVQYTDQGFPELETAPRISHPQVVESFCAGPAFPGSLSGDRCGLTATDGSDLCWRHLAEAEQEQAEKGAA